MHFCHGWRSRKDVHGVPTPKAIRFLFQSYKARIARNMMSNHTEMQDKYSGDCYDIHPNQSQYEGKHKRGGAAEGRATSFVVAADGSATFVLALSRMNTVNIVAVATILVSHDGAVGNHVPRH